DQCAWRPISGMYNILLHPSVAGTSNQGEAGMSWSTKSDAPPLPELIEDLIESSRSYYRFLDKRCNRTFQAVLLLLCSP
ncbi:hypothetical protein BT69DRAFT_1284522, partial [Atractiella rhizophila]